MDVRTALIKYGYSIWWNYRIVFGTVIFGANMGYAHKSPIFENKVDTISILRVTLVSLFKGTLYGITYPISPLIMVLNACHHNDATFTHHLIPGSVYCKKKTRGRLQSE
jgi:hypothetical protein